MKILLFLLLAAYVVAVNVYSFLLVRSLKRNLGNKAKQKMLLAGALGGAVTEYICMYLFKYKLDDILLMLVLPVLAVINGYLIFLAVRSGMSFYVV